MHRGRGLSNCQCNDSFPSMKNGIVWKHFDGNQRLHNTLNWVNEMVSVFSDFPDVGQKYVNYLSLSLMINYKKKHDLIKII